ncbi:hypothetical protein [Rhodoblastus sp.]|uniref:hypothetical protein n=1 Tax=Rhodoblastus sp. TaxID=1962975 RepID=UPI0025FABBF0|nr:hypothetical protein [Rhodoblastus sp.]
MKFPDDMLFEQFNRRDEDDFDGLAKMIAERLRDGIDEAGAKWLADLFNPTESKLPYRATLSRRQGYKKENDNKPYDDFITFYDAYYSEWQDVNRAREKVQLQEWQGGLGWDRTKAYKIAKEFREYLEAIRD